MRELLRQDDSPVDSALLEYLEVLEAGREPDTEALLAHLSKQERAVFHETLHEILWARDQIRKPLHRGQLIAQRFELREQIGSGGFSCVWRAKDRHLDREVAIKFLNQLGSGRTDIERFRTEVQALARTSCRGVAQVLDIGTDDGRPFIVLELVAGRSVASILEDVRARTPARAVPAPEDLRTATRLPCPRGAEDMLVGPSWFDVCARLAVSVLRTVETIHSAGIRHRDIKPHNVLLRGCGMPVLIDFGLATLWETRNEPPTEGLSGSISYMAPEQLRRNRTGDDGRTDVYQVGLLLYEFLTLKPAFGTQRGEAAIEDNRAGHVAPPWTELPGVPHDLGAICMRALETDPEDRYQAASAFREDLERWLDGVVPPVAIWTAGWMPRLRRGAYFVRRHGRVACGLIGLAIGAALVALIAGG